MVFRAASAEDRFGFREVGSIRLRRKCETPVFVAMMSTFAVMIVLVLLSIPKSEELSAAFVSGDAYMMNKVLLSFLSIGMSMVVSFVIIVGWIIAISVVMSGIHAEFRADDTALTISAPKKADILLNYDEIEEVRITRQRLLLKDRYYRIYIRTKYRDYTFETILPRKKSDRTPQNSPFYILVQRGGLTRKVWTEFSSAWVRQENQHIQ